MIQNFKELVNMNMNNYSLSILRTILLFIVLKIISRLLLLIFGKHIKRSKNIFLFHQSLNVFLNILSIILLLTIWYPYLKNISTVISFISAGLTIAIRDIILNLFAGIYIKTSKPFKIEDRISIDGIKGDVVLLNVLSFKMLEVGDRINGEQSSGLIINVPNSFVFSKSLKNYNTAFKYIWDEITIRLNIDCDLDKNKNEIMSIVNNNEILSSIPKKMKKEIKNASIDYRLYYNHLDPIIYTKVVDKHIELDIRFLVHPKKSRIVEDEIWNNILKKYKEGKIDIYKD